MTSELDRGKIKQANAEIAAVLGAIDAATPDGFRAIDPAQLPAKVMSDVRNWRSKVLLPGAEGDAKDIRFFVHLSDEPAVNFVRMVRTFGAFEVVEIHSPEVISIWIRARDKGVRAEAVTVDDYARTAHAFFNLSSVWHPRPPSDAEQGLAVSTAPNRSIYNMPDWSDRSDAGVHAGYFHFMFYKRYSQLNGLGLPGRWFDDEFRRHYR